ncbi:hypothetical protein AVEN_68675-1 [Araneus ventricosus]|uniref:Mutator-like transposase domain-containing protein n=1 Tax=Araneus ventricosus TaxID=182803 RepID=A0A4Y2RJY2_ARAVE|nr:hypothetical protein AVEN_68675-1 [Araneus ventricosus]
MDTVSRRYRKLKGRTSKRKRLCASIISKRWEKNKVENSAISVGAESCLGNEGKEKKNSLNLSATKLEVLPSTSASTSNAIQKNPYVIMNNSMGSSLLSNTKCDECNMCSLDVTSNDTYGFSSKIEVKCKNCEKVFKSIFPSPRDNIDKSFEENKKLVEAFSKIGKDHAALEVFQWLLAFMQWIKKHFQNVYTNCMRRSRVIKMTFFKCL